MSQLAPRTGIIADAYVPFRWKPALRPTFCARTLEKKKKRQRSRGSYQISRDAWQLVTNFEIDFV